MRRLSLLLLAIFMIGMSLTMQAQEEDIFTIVEKMPVFPGCEGETQDELKKCTEVSLLKFMYKNIAYPALARENGVEGLVVVTFVVNQNGEIEQPKVLKDIGGGCGEESLRVLNLINELPKWQPGKKDGEAVKVRYNLPVRFRLQSEEVAPIEVKTFDIDNEKDSIAGIFDLLKVDKIPTYPGCQTMDGDTAQWFCTEIRLMNYIYANRYYPMMARMNDLEGVVYVTFVIAENGAVENIEILEDIGDGCGDEIIRILNNMTNDVKWIPAQVNNKNVKVRMIVPVEFKLKG